MTAEVTKCAFVGDVEFRGVYLPKIGTMYFCLTLHAKQ